MRSKIFILGSVFMLAVGVLSAQSLKIGAKAGATMYKIDGVSFSDQFNWGYHAGGFIEGMWSKHMGIQPEVLFVQSNTRTATQFNQLYPSATSNLVDVKLNYLTIPVLLNIKPFSFVTFQAGPQFSVLMNKNRTLLQNGQDAFKNNHVSLLGGVQLNLFQFRIYGRYGVDLNSIKNVDINNVSANVADNWKGQLIQIGAGLAF